MHLSRNSYVSDVFIIVIFISSHFAVICIHLSHTLHAIIYSAAEITFYLVATNDLNGSEMCLECCRQNLTHHIKRRAKPCMWSTVNM